MGLETPLPPEGRPANDVGEAAPFDDWPTPAGPAPDLPPIAAKADDLEGIKAAVDDAAAVSGGLWLSYVTAFVYLAVAAGAVSHKDLFFENPVKLPFFNVELPLVAFFFLAPILFVVVHAYTLVHLAMLGDKSRRFHQVLNAQISGNKAVPKQIQERNAVIRDGLRRQLASNIFVQFLAGPREDRQSSFGWLLYGIAWITLAVGPVFLLLLIQIQFLPFHGLFVTWTQRITLGIDLALLSWLWRKIMAGRWLYDRQSPWYWVLGGIVDAVIAIVAIWFSWTVVTFPGEWQEALLGKWGWAKWTVAAHDWLFNGPVDETTRRRASLFSSTLVLTGLNIYEALGIDDPDKAKWRDSIFLARGRDLRGSILDYASLPKVDFTGADLQGALLRGAQLQGASFWRAQLQGASFYSAQLEGAKLDGANLRGALLQEAHLQGASLNCDVHITPPVCAQLQGASLDRAQLQGASLNRAQLQGASLDRAQLQGASLSGAQLQGASFAQADLEAADFSDAYLWRTNRPEPPSAIDAIQISGESWLPEWRDEDDSKQPWDDQAYQALWKTLDSLPSGKLRDDALKRIQSLDCSSSDKTLASCDPNATAPPEAAWQKTLEARVDDGAYAKALATVLRALVCENTIHVVRGAGFEGRLKAAGAAASELIDDLTNKDSKDCPVAASLTDADRANLLQIKRRIEPAKTPGD